MKQNLTILGRRTDRRGSVMIVLLGLLAFITLLFTTLSVTARLEIRAAHNFANGIRDNMIVASGVAVARVALSQYDGPVAANQPWGRPRASANSPIGVPQRGNGANQARFLSNDPLWGGRPPLDSRGTAIESAAGAQRREVYDPAASFGFAGADIVAEDESGKLNINAAGWYIDTESRAAWRAEQKQTAVGDARFMNRDTPRRAIRPRRLDPKDIDGITMMRSDVGGGARSEPDEVLMTSPVDLDLTLALAAMLTGSGVATDVEAARLAQAIIEYRYGPDKRPGRAGVDDNFNSIRSKSARPAMDGLDNDGDGVIDNPEERWLAVLSNGWDDNGDGVVDDEGEALERNGLDDDRDGMVDEDGEGIDDPAEFVSDPRLPPNGDDRPFLRVEDLKKVPGMTDEIYQVLKDRVTVLSGSSDVVVTEAMKKAATANLRGGVDDVEEVPMVAINSATVLEIETHLNRFFPQWPAGLARQFAANIVDARDADRIPTLIPGLDGEPVLGIERTPYINEVWSDSITLPEDGDDGQFVELFNPYDTPMDVAGWRLMTGTSVVTLQGQIAPGGFLVVTDDATGARPEPAGMNRPGYGSLYDIFGVVGNNSTRRVLDVIFFDIPDDAGEIRLVDAQGHLIDRFVYSGGLMDGAIRSFQRNDPRVRVAERAAPTPLERNANWAPPTGMDNEDLFDRAEARDHAFASVADLLHVYAGWSGQEMAMNGGAASGSGGMRKGLGASTVGRGRLADSGRMEPARGAERVNIRIGEAANPTGQRNGADALQWCAQWAYPQIFSEDAREPDFRLLDVFCLNEPAGAADAAWRMEEALRAGTAAVSPAGGARMREMGPVRGDGPQTVSVSVSTRPTQSSDGTAPDGPWERPARDMFRVGRINVNTAPYEVLAAVAYVFPDGTTFAQRVAGQREVMTQSLVGSRDSMGAPFESLGRFFQSDALFGDLTPADRILVARRLAGVLTTGSDTFRVTVRTLREDENGPRLRYTRAAQALVVDSKTQSQVVTWDYVPNAQ